MCGIPSLLESFWVTGPRGFRNLAMQKVAAWKYFHCAGVQRSRSVRAAPNT